jgi:hypothetical protein
MERYGAEWNGHGRTDNEETTVKNANEKKKPCEKKEREEREKKQDRSNYPSL